MRASLEVYVCNANINAHPQRSFNAEEVAQKAEERRTWESGDEHHRKAILHGGICIVVDVLNDGIEPILM